MQMWGESILELISKIIFILLKCLVLELFLASENIIGEVGCWVVVLPAVAARGVAK